MIIARAHAVLVTDYLVADVRPPPCIPEFVVVLLARLDAEVLNIPGMMVRQVDPVVAKVGHDDVLRLLVSDGVVESKPPILVLCYCAERPIERIYEDNGGECRIEIGVALLEPSTRLLEACLKLGIKLNTGPTRGLEQVPHTLGEQADASEQIGYVLALRQGLSHVIDDGDVLLHHGLVLYHVVERMGEMGSTNPIGEHDIMFGTVDGDGNFHDKKASRIRAGLKWLECG
jgi:hypothetical protein